MFRLAHSCDVRGMRKKKSTALVEGVVSERVHCKSSSSGPMEFCRCGCLDPILESIVQNCARSVRLGAIAGQPTLALPSWPRVAVDLSVGIPATVSAEYLNAITFACPLAGDGSVGWLRMLWLKFSHRPPPPRGLTVQIAGSVMKIIDREILSFDTRK